MKIVATIEARMTSSRLPGKVLLPCGGKPMLDHLIRRLRKTPALDEIVLATTTNATDDVLVEYAQARGIKVHRGSEDDVMSRVIGAAELGGAGASDREVVVVEITGDCPVLDPNLIEQTIRMFVKNPCDYVSNVGEPEGTYPGGMDAQVFRLETLKKSFALTDLALDREHVTSHIRRSPEHFRILELVAPPDLHWPELALMLDEPKDYELLRNIIEHFGEAHPYFTCAEIFQLLRVEHPEWLAINQDVKRKGYS